DFFELGGQSLKATILISRLHKEFNVKITLSDMFKNTTVRGLGKFIKDASEDRYLSLQPVKEQEHYPLSHSQLRLWIVGHLEKGTEVYNMPGRHFIEGTLDLAALKRAFRTLLQRHESLRTTFIQVDEQPRQKIHKEMEPDIKIIDISDKNEEEKNALSRRYSEEEALAPFNLEKGPLVRLKILKLSEQKYLALFGMHHIISDDLSVDIFYSQLTTLYEAYAGGRENPLAPPRLQYKDYAVWETDLLSESKLKELKAFWTGYFGTEKIRRLDMPLDKPRPKVQTFNGDRLRVRLDKELTQKAYRMIENYHVTLYVFFLGIFNVFLA
ncbi:MAG: hypothetical protein GY757_03980, partial [bacterium]|nr:hypothetical protein [bacterium]